MSVRGLTNATKTQRVLNATAVGTTNVNTSVVDTAGFGGVRFIVLYGAVTDGTNSIKAQQGTASDGSDMADLAGTNVAVAATDDNKLAVVEVIRPRERYVRAVVVRGGATGAVIDGAIAELFDPAVEAVTKHADVAAQETHLAPAEGTA